MKQLYTLMLSLAMLSCLAGCGKKIPGDIIQPRDMELLLYDYHLAQVVSNDAPAYKREPYIEYVFRKYGFTQEEFDSSMVWYTRNGEKLAEIYANVASRLEREESHMKLLADRLGSQISVSMVGDTVNVWQDRSLFWLSPSPLANRLSFDLKADTTFKPYDKMELEAVFTFVPMATPAQGSRAVVGLRYQFENDSVQGTVRTIRASGSQRVSLQADSAFQIKSVTGFVYYSQDDSEVPGGVIIDNIRFMRYHDDGTAALRDSLAAVKRAQEALEEEETAKPAPETKKKTENKAAGSKSKTKASEKKSSKSSADKSKKSTDKSKKSADKSKSSAGKSKSKTSKSKSSDSKVRPANAGTEAIKSKAAETDPQAAEELKAKASEVDPAVIEEMRAKAEEAKKNQ